MLSFPMHLCVRHLVDTAANATWLEQTLQIQVEEKSGCFNRYAGEQICRRANLAARSPTVADGGIGFGGSRSATRRHSHISSPIIHPPYFIPCLNSQCRTAIKKAARALTLLRKVALEFQVATGPIV
jgi:hypothetical protein